MKIIVEGTSDEIGIYKESSIGRKLYNGSSYVEFREMLNGEVVNLHMIFPSTDNRNRTFGGYIKSLLASKLPYGSINPNLSGSKHILKDQNSPVG